eukprot:364491-Chlamydomonas_euryale.AAC.18
MAGEEEEAFCAARNAFSDAPAPGHPPLQPQPVPTAPATALPHNFIPPHPPSFAPCCSPGNHLANLTYPPAAPPFKSPQHLRRRECGHATPSSAPALDTLLPPAWSGSDPGAWCARRPPGHHTHGGGAAAAGMVCAQRRGEPVCAGAQLRAAKQAADGRDHGCAATNSMGCSAQNSVGRHMPVWVPSDEPPSKQRMDANMGALPRT